MTDCITGEGHDLLTRAIAALSTTPIVQYFEEGNSPDKFIDEL